MHKSYKQQSIYKTSNWILHIQGFLYSIHYREKIDLRKKKEKNKINTIRDEKEDVTTDIIEIEKSGITTNTYLSAKWQSKRNDYIAEHIPFTKPRHEDRDHK